jgi:hypothetical protein
MSNIKPMLRNAKFVKKQTVELIIQSVRRSIRYKSITAIFLNYPTHTDRSDIKKSAVSSPDPKHSVSKNVQLEKVLKFS